MNILILNGSPKGTNSTTLYTALYLEALHLEHNFNLLHVGQRIKSFEKNFDDVKTELEKADLLLFAYPVYTFIAPYQIHRFIELIKEHKVNLTGKIATQITTSKHFYDVTAHRFIEENCWDLGMNVVRGLSADMDDLLTEKGRKEARDFFDQVIFSCTNNMFLVPSIRPPKVDYPYYRAVLGTELGAEENADSKKETKNRSKDVVIVTNCSAQDANLAAMIEDFRSALPYTSRVVNIREFPFSGGCLGCFGCAVTGACVHKDRFDDFLREKIQKADAIVYAFTIENHYSHSSLKCYDDRQFCNGHRTVTHGTPIAYIISGNYPYEHNLQTIVEARSEVGGNYLSGIVNDVSVYQSMENATGKGESTPEKELTRQLTVLAQALDYALEKKLSRPANFYGVGGMKIFRDLIYVMQGLMKADHRFYKKHGIYDFPQKQKKRILQMKLIGALIAIPNVQKKMKGKMNTYIIDPYKKVVEETKPRG